MKPFRVRCAAILIGAPLAALAPALAEEPCDAWPLAERLYQRLQADGRSNAEILDILGSGFKRGVLRSRIVDSSGCSADQVEEALAELQDIARE